MSPQKQTVTVGIDLGTTWSEIATLDDSGEVRVLPNIEGDLKTPSVVMFEEGNPEAIVGKIAAASAKAMAERVVMFAKREIGREPPFAWEIDGKKYRPEEISALVLRKLKQDAEQALGGQVEVHRAVITVPAYFDEARRLATRAAGELAGLEVLGILDEPVAAAIAYSLDKLDQDQTVVVYDLGGGTFDVTVMKVGGGQVQVLAKGGNAELGGKDWDMTLVEHAARKFQEEHGEDPTDDPGSFQALYDAALAAKEALSRVGKARITVGHAGKRTVVAITREEFNALTAHLLDQTKATLEGILKEVPGLSGWGQIDKVLLVGGSVRMPQVKEAVTAVIGHEPSVELDPDTCVARGAALYAMALIRRMSEQPPRERLGAREKQSKEAIQEEVERLGPSLEKIPNITFVSASSRFYGFEALDLNDNMRPFNSILIRKNQRIPAVIEETYSSIMDNQTGFVIKVLESDTEERDSQSPSVKVIRQGEISGIPPGYPRGSPLDVRYEFCEDGILKVHARFRPTGHELMLDVKPAGGMTRIEMEQAKQKLAGLRVS